MSHNFLLKQKNLWPTKDQESWKYFDFKNFESLTKDSLFKKAEMKITYSEATEDEIKITPFECVISQNLAEQIKVSLVSKFHILNPQTKIDFRLTALNFEGVGLKVEIKDKKDLDLKIVYSNNADYESNLNCFVFLDVHNSNITLLEQDLVRAGSFFSAHTQIQMSHSKIEHVTLFANSGERELRHQAKVYNSEVRVEEESLYINTSVFIKNKLIRAQQSLSLMSSSSEGQLKAFSISDDKHFSELRTEVMHLAPKTKSRQLFKVLAADESRSVFSGRIFVDSIAQKSDAAQLCQGVLLSGQAEIDAKPELEINADDVKAAHGAAIGQIGHDQIFYLVSRGIKPEVAYQLISKAFAGEVIATIQSKKLRSLCRHTVEESSIVIFEKLADCFK